MLLLLTAAELEEDVGMVASGESQMRMMVVHGRFQDGFSVALVPADLSPEQVESACRVRERTDTGKTKEILSAGHDCLRSNNIEERENGETPVPRGTTPAPGIRTD